MEAQFVRVRAKSFYGLGSGLQFLQLAEKGKEYYNQICFHYMWVLKFLPQIAIPTSSAVKLETVKSWGPIFHVEFEVLVLKFKNFGVLFSVTNHKGIF